MISEQAELTQHLIQLRKIRTTNKISSGAPIADVPQDLNRFVPAAARVRPRHFVDAIEDKLNVVSTHLCNKPVNVFPRQFISRELTLNALVTGKCPVDRRK